MSIRVHRLGYSLATWYRTPLVGGGMEQSRCPAEYCKEYSTALCPVNVWTSRRTDGTFTMNVTHHRAGFRMDELRSHHREARVYARGPYDVAPCCTRPASSGAKDANFNDLIQNLAGARP